MYAFCLPSSTRKPARFEARTSGCEDTILCSSVHIWFTSDVLRLSFHLPTLICLCVTGRGARSCVFTWFINQPFLFTVEICFCRRFIYERGQMSLAFDAPTRRRDANTISISEMFFLVERFGGSCRRTMLLIWFEVCKMKQLSLPTFKILPVMTRMSNKFLHCCIFFIHRR